MSLFRRKIAETDSSQSKNPKVVAFLELESYISSLFSSDSYIAKSRYQQKLKESEEMINFYKGLIEGEILNDFCKKQSLKEKEVFHFFEEIKNIEEKVKVHNEDFIQNKLSSEKQYLDDILKEVDLVISLDDDQNRCRLHFW